MGRDRSPNPDAVFAAGGTTEESRDRTVQVEAGFIRQIREACIPTLRVVAGADLLRFATLAPGERVLVGRDESADLRLRDGTVSKRHARFEYGPDGVEVTDLGSTNGSFVNGRRVRHALVRAGDQVALGSAVLRLELLTMDQVRHLATVASRVEAAHRDPLTGLLTRAFLDQELPQLASRSAAAGVPISALFLDIDHFKRINDRHGHQVGDAVLAACARMTMLAVRDADPCIRYGGEEFLVVLPGTDGRRAAEVAERLRASLEAHDWSSIVPGLRVTTSAGVAERLPHESVRAWVRRADEALYAAKRAGRNRIVVAA